MYVAMNRFRVTRGSEQEFEQVWASRERRLSDMAGFVSFHLLRGPIRDDHTLYASQSVWESHDLFLAWTRSEQFRASHRNAGNTKPLYLGPPDFEGFEAVLSEIATPGGARPD
jgi:heme-degrading monooxygenase HmoA